MKVLIACEESQRSCIEFRKRGHEAYSCDVLPCSGGHPEWHIKGDAISVINGGGGITLQDRTKIDVDRWDLVIAHPPCTYLTVTGNKYFETSIYGEKARERQKKRYKAIVFFMELAKANVEKIAIENPVGIMSTAWRKPDQIIQPYQFGDHARKATCLWLKGLNKLVPTNIVDPGFIHLSGLSHGASADYATNEKGKILRWSDEETAKIRSKTFPGIARAFAEQWG